MFCVWTWSTFQPQGKISFSVFVICRPYLHTSHTEIYFFCSLQLPRPNKPICVISSTAKQFSFHCLQQATFNLIFTYSRTVSPSAASSSVTPHHPILPPLSLLSLSLFFLSPPFLPSHFPLLPFPLLPFPLLTSEVGPILRLRGLESA